MVKEIGVAIHLPPEGGSILANFWMNNNIHIFTLNWRGLDKLRVLNKGLEKNCSYNFGFFTDYHWNIRDNGSNDGTYQEAAYWKNTTVYDIGHNRDNFSQGMNYLFKKSKAKPEDYILLLNNDIVFNDDESLLHMFELQKQTNSDIIGARLLYPGTNNLQHASVIFSNSTGRLPYHFRHKEESDANAEKNRYFQATTAAVCLVKASAFIAIGGFDEGFMWSFEDIDACLRIGKLKTNNIAYCGQTNISHEESASLKKNPVNKMFMAQNVKLFKEKWWKDGNPTYKIDHDLYLNDPDYNVI